MKRGTPPSTFGTLVSHGYNPLFSCTPTKLPKLDIPTPIKQPNQHYLPNLLNTNSEPGYLTAFTNKIIPLLPHRTVVPTHRNNLLLPNNTSQIPLQQTLNTGGARGTAHSFLTTSTSRGGGSSSALLQNESSVQHDRNSYQQLQTGTSKNVYLDKK